jgi:hypothetical protein
MISDRPDDASMILGQPPVPAMRLMAETFTKLFGLAVR